jgi:hypothetical protein
MKKNLFAQTFSRSEFILWFKVQMSFTKYKISALILAMNSQRFKNKGGTKTASDRPRKTRLP